MQKLALSRRVEGNLAVLGSGGCGGKATRLLQMGRHLRGQTIARIPKTDVLTTEVTNVIKIDPIDNGPPILDKLKLKPGFKAIRSSAHAEDSGSVMGVNCPGVFDTRFHDFRDGDLISLANTVATVAASAESSKATAYAERNGITNGGMAVIIQSVVGTNVGEGHFGPLFSGVLDTSPINGDGTITFSVVLGLGTSAVGGIHNANVLIAKKGSFSKRTIDVIARQKLGELLSHTRGISEELETDALLRIFSKFRSINDAMDFFIKHYMNSLYILSLALETVFDRKPIDLEFAISPKTGRLYLLQARHSNMRRVKNPDYPENIKEEDIIAISRTVLGAKTSSTKLVVSLSQEQYSREAREGFSSLLSIDAENKPYILVVPPEATSSKHEQLPLTMLKNVVHIVEKLVPDQIHTPGVSGVDHMSRLVAELDLGYMEAHVNFERIAKNSNVRPYGNVTLYEGNFGAAVCSATSKGVFYLEKI